MKILLSDSAHQMVRCKNNFIVGKRRLAFKLTVSKTPLLFKLKFQVAAATKLQPQPISFFSTWVQMCLLMILMFTCESRFALQPQ